MSGKKQFAKHKRCSAFTLVEVLIALVISVIMVLGITTILQFNFVYQNQQELRASATDALSHETEKLKRQWIFTVPPYYTVTVSDNRTPDNPYDDTHGTLHVQLFNRNGVALATPPANDDRVTVVMTVTWRGRGRLSGNSYRQSLVSYMIP